MNFKNYCILAACLAVTACTPKFIKNYKKSIVENPTTQAQKDQNIILNYLTEKELDYQKTESGIYYTFENEGEGAKPSIDATVKVHYRGTLLDGKEFDSSYKRGQPAAFPLANLIEGWKQCIPLLGKGGKGTFVIPSGLAYGPRGAGSDIPANAVLSFDIELIDFMDPAMQRETDDKLIQDYLKTNSIQAQRTESGIYFTIDKEGTGANPTPASTVEVHYEGTLLDGTVFDSSYKRGQTISFPLNRVIQGWQEGIPLLKEGGQGTLYIPSHLAYGPRPAGSIPPNSVLIFKVELFDVK